MKDYLEQQLGAILHDLGVPDDFTLDFETPNNPDHGDLSTNAALRLARHLRRAPRQIAQDLQDRLQALPLDPTRIAAVEIAGPGFLNFHFAKDYLNDGLRALLDAGDAYGRSDAGQGQAALVEFVSANPTGPLTVGHGRNAVLGDTLATLMDWTGYAVTREYYFNDAGRQMRVLGASVQARYRALVNPDEPTKAVTLSNGETIEVPATFPYEGPKDHGYLGDYITDIAQQIAARHGDAWLDADDETPFKGAAEQAMFAEIEATLARLGIKMDTYFNEHTLYTTNRVWDVVEALREKGLAYDQDGAVWFKTTAFGKDKDTVLVKSTGEPTYRLPDIAYHIDKFDRGFERMIDIFGADHIATYPDVLSGLQALGYDADKVEVVIYQFVTLLRGGQPVKMSTRRAEYVTLDDLMDEVGEDVTRFFFLMRSPNTHLEFDLDLAKEASDKNPVFYLQYAHARICSILRKAEETGVTFGEVPNLSLLRHDAEVTLIKTVLQLPDVIAQTAAAREPHRLANYLREVAVAFTQFYGHCRILGEARDLATARMHLAQATRIVLHNGLAVLGISAPEQM